MRIVAMLVGVWLLVAARPADACGFWSMADKQKKTEVGFLINSASITSGKKRIGAFYLDIESKSGMRVVKGREVVYDIKGDKLRKRGKVVATISGETITFGKKQYTIELTDPHEMHDMPAWRLAVRRDSELIVEGEHASSLCAGLHREMTPAEHEEEVRRRVIYYLAWRELGG
jgi:hypothetical protein